MSPIEAVSSDKASRHQHLHSHLKGIVEPMMVIGIVGGIASGKSAVAEIFRQLGAAVIHADQIGHEVLANPQTRRRLRRRWGEREF